MKNEDYQLSNGTILIRPHQMEDAQPCFEAIIESMDELMPWMFWCHADLVFSEIEGWVESRSQAWLNDTDYDFAILDCDQGAFIGNCGLVRVDLQNRRAELGYWIRTSQTRQGFATQASRLALQFAFEVLNLNRIEILIATDNKNSQKVAEKLGAKQEGILRQRLNIHDTFRDAYLYSIIADDPKSR
jgi:RimJ/RimL family protein N-acetyltransferase